MTVWRAGVACALSLTFVSCGGGSEDGANDDRGIAATANPTPAFDKAGFTSAAEATCADFNARAPDKEPRYTSIAQIQAALTMSVAAFTEFQGKLATLQYPPGAEGAELRRILVVETEKNLLELRSTSAQMDTAVATKNQEKFYEAADRLVAFQDASPDKQGTLKAYGLPECDLAFGVAEGERAPRDALSPADGARCRLFYRAYAAFGKAVTSGTRGQVDDRDRQLLRDVAARAQELSLPSAVGLRDALQAVAQRAEDTAVASSRTGRIDIAPVNKAVDRVQAVCAQAPAP